ncbi:MAG: MSHA pilin protein MshC, partial [Moritella dasanensis]
NPYACNKVLIVAESSTEPSRFGIPTNCDDENSTPLKLPVIFNPPQLGMSKAEADSSAIKFSAHTIEFDPRGIASSCAGCNIEIKGEQTLKIRIESQGYIHEQ